jgi:hypothetical protein
MQFVVRDVAASDTCGQAHAATDIYCSHQRTSRIQYPLPLIAGLIGAGVLAFLVTGFVGYYNCTIPYVVNGQTQLDIHGGVLCWHDAASGFLYLREPWPLYLWFSALMIVLQVSILRDKRLLHRLIATLVTALLSIVVVAVVYLYGQGAVVNFLTSLLYQPWTWVVANFGLILAFVVDSTRRWLRFRATEMRQTQGDDPSASMIARAEQAKAIRARVGERIAGDLIAAMLLCAGLSIVFSDFFVQGVLASMAGAQFACGPTLFYPFATYVPLAHIHGTVQQFVQSLLAGKAVAPYPCPIPVGPRLPVPLDSIAATDLLLAGIFFVPGVGVLANTAFIRGLAPLSGTRQQTQGATAPAPSHLADNPNAGDIAGRVGLSVFETLLEALEHYILPYVRSAALSLRNILWPLLILIASFSFALCSKFIQYYLHHYDPTYNCDKALNIPNCSPTNITTYLELAVIFGVIGFAGTICSAALLLLSGRVVSNSLRFLGRIGTVMLLTLWLFSFALFGFNWFLLDTGIVPRALSIPLPQSAGLCDLPSWQIMLAPSDPACRQPFSLSWVASISFAALILAVFYLVLRLRRVSARPVATRTSSSST